MIRCLIASSLALLVPAIALAQYGAQPVPGSSPTARQTRAVPLAPVPVDDDVTPVPAPPARPAAPSAAAPAPTPAAPQATPDGEADKLTAIGQALEALGKNLTVVTGDPDVKIILGGAIIADFLYNSARPVAPGTPFFLAPPPAPGFSQNTFDATGRQTQLGAVILGPQIGPFKSGGVVAAVLYSSSLVEDLWGLLPILAYGELKNDYWRFAAGLQLDIFNPLNPNVLPITYLGASGNVGAFRGQARVERFFHPTCDSQITLTGGISDPEPTTITNRFRINEDAGWPNVEARVALALGPLKGEGLDKKRPFEVGVSGVVGQIRTTVPAVTQVIADVWGAGGDVRWAITPRLGIQGEYYIGQTLGTYMGGILQNVNAVTFQPLRANGGWAEVYFYLCPEKLHVHFGYGIDDALDTDLAPGQPTRNQTWFSNVIWDLDKHVRFGIELTYRNTSYVGLGVNDGFGLQTQMRLNF